MLQTGSGQGIGWTTTLDYFQTSLYISTHTDSELCLVGSSLSPFAADGYAVIRSRVGRCCLLDCELSICLSRLENYPILVPIVDSCSFS